MPVFNPGVKSPVGDSPQLPVNIERLWDSGVHYLQPMARYLKKSHPEMRGSRALRGGLLMMSKSGGLKPRAVAGKPSVTRLTQSSWTGIRASGKPSAAVRKMLHKQAGL